VLSSDARLRKLAGGFQFIEGTVWHPALGGLVFSDIPGNRMYLWRLESGVTVFRDPSNHADGNTVDPQGRLLTCEHGTRRVVRQGHHGSLTVLVDKYQGHRLNSPNDIVVKSDGTIWFSDPPYGIGPEESELPANYVFRLDPDDSLTIVADDFMKPNGLCFSPDESVLYISDTGDERHHIRRFRVQPDNTLSGGEVFATISPGKSDGIRVDTKARVWTTAGEGIWVLSPEGELLTRVMVPEMPANCAFGGEGNHTLFVAARTGLYAVDTLATGVRWATGAMG